MLYNCKNGEYAYTNTHNVILLIKFDELSQIRSTIPAADMLSPLPAIWMTWVQTRLGATQILLWSSPPPPHTHDGGRVDQWHTMASRLSTDKEWIVHHKTRSLCIDLLRSTNVAVSSERSLGNSTVHVSPSLVPRPSHVFQRWKVWDGLGTRLTEHYIKSTPHKLTHSHKSLLLLIYLKPKVW